MPVRSGVHTSSQLTVLLLGSSCTGLTSTCSARFLKSDDVPQPQSFWQNLAYGVCQISACCVRQDSGTPWPLFPIAMCTGIELWMHAQRPSPAYRELRHNSRRCEKPRKCTNSQAPSPGHLLPDRCGCIRSGYGILCCAGVHCDAFWT